MPRAVQEAVAANLEVEGYHQGNANGGPGGESAELLRAQSEFAEARTAPSGIVNPGAYSTAFGQLRDLPSVGTSWNDVTKVPYDADDPEFRDYYSNSSGGSGLVTGRITGLAADNANYVYAASAAGGVWRSSQGGGNWVAIADGLPALSSGDLELHNGELWYATGEANTGGTSYVGSGVYRLTNPRTGSFSEADRVGGTELESTTINSIRFSGDYVWAATLRGVWRHSATTNSGAWTLMYAPNPRNLPAALQPYVQQIGGQPAFTVGGGQTAGNTNAAYANIVNDIAVDPRSENHIVAAIGWRSGALTLDGAVVYYNGFYESKDAGLHWAKINPTGVMPADDIGFVNFAYAPDGRLYAINQSPRLLNKLTGVVNSLLDGIYVSMTGNPAGPWSRIADSHKLATSGSALKQTEMGKGYGPGVQAWYNQFITVDPTNSAHVVAGLEEVYDTRDAGATWKAVGPYWNFTLESGCWWLDAVYPPNGTPNRCPQTTHPDQHEATVGTVNGVLTLFVGNDGGVYSRPLNSNNINRNGNATDWKSLNDGSMDALQYYAVDTGVVPQSGVTWYDAVTKQNKQVSFTGALGGNGVIVSGGLQDNGGSIMRVGAGEMSSNFGGDGGDVLVNPNNGCQILQEYVVLSMSVTENCAQNKGQAFIDTSVATTWRIRPPEINARFIAPFVANQTNIDEWLAGGNSLWIQNKGFAIRSGSEWTKAYTLSSAARVYTALAMRGDKLVGGWCGTCNNNGFRRGVTIGTRGADEKWTFTEIGTGLPNRYVGGVAIGPDGSIYAAMNGFSRRFTEGEGAGIGHVFKWNGTSWDDISANFPDVPANTIQALADGSLVVATDLAVLYRAPGATQWQRLGPQPGQAGALPATIALDVELGPDGFLYAATHGRGIWRIAKP